MKTLYIFIDVESLIGLKSSPIKFSRPKRLLPPFRGRHHPHKWTFGGIFVGVWVLGSLPLMKEKQQVVTYDVHRLEIGK